MQINQQTLSECNLFHAALHFPSNMHFALQIYFLKIPINRFLYLMRFVMIFLVFICLFAMQHFLNVINDLMFVKLRVLVYIK